MYWWHSAKQAQEETLGMCILRKHCFTPALTSLPLHCCTHWLVRFWLPISRTNMYPLCKLLIYFLKINQNAAESRKKSKVTPCCSYKHLDIILEGCESVSFFQWRRVASFPSCCHVCCTNSTTKKIVEKWQGEKRWDSRAARANFLHVLTHCFTGSYLRAPQTLLCPRISTANETPKPIFSGIYIYIHIYICCII
jgi:hypothetical protein